MFKKIKNISNEKLLKIIKKFKIINQNIQFKKFNFLNRKKIL
jgi:hypothetical protein